MRRSSNPLWNLGFNARTVPQMRDAVVQIRSVDNPQAIPALALIDRQAPGWLRVITGPLVLSLLALIWFVLFLAGMSVVVLVLGLAVRAFVDTLWPGLGLPWLVVLVLLTDVLLPHSSQLTNILNGPLLEPTDPVVPRWLQLILWPAWRLGQVMAIVLSGLLLSLTLFPILLLLSQVVYHLIVLDWELILNLSQSNYLLVLAFLLVVVVTVLLLRKRSRKGLIRLNAWVFGALGVGFLYRYSEANWPGTGPTVAGLMAGAALAYPLGLSHLLARLASRPYAWLSDSLVWFLPRLLLRWQLAGALLHHGSRNSRNVGGKGGRAVCRKHLVRFERSTVSLSYFRRMSYWSCPICNDDKACYHGVRVIQGCLDQSMSASERKVGSTLEISLLGRGDSDGLIMPAGLERVIIREPVEESMLNAFFSNYRQLSNVSTLRPLCELVCRVDPHLELDTQTQQHLHQAFGEISCGG